MKKRITVAYYLLLAFVLSCASALVQAQYIQAAFLDLGSNTLSEGLALRPSFTGGYFYEDYYANTGLQFTFSKEERKAVSAYFLSGGKYFRIQDSYLSGGLFFLLNPYSDLTREMNFGAMFTYGWKHVDLNLGYNVRLYTLDPDNLSGQSFGDDADLRIWEYRNIMYRGVLRLKENDSPWNAYIALTNFDSFLIQQETNPMLYGGGNFRLKESLQLFAEIWYQGAGMLNLSSNYFGYYVRTGIVWRFVK